MSFPPTSIVNVTFVNSSFPPQQPTIPPWLMQIPGINRIAFFSCHSGILVLSVVGNTSIIAIVARNPSLRTTINYLIANMAAVDLIASVVVTGRFFSIVHHLSRQWDVPGVFGNILCKICPYIRNVSIAVSIYSMVAIALDRFFAVVFPVRAMPRVMKIRFLLPSIWFVSLGFFSVDLINYKLVSYPDVDICYSSWPSGIDVHKAKVIYHALFLTFFFLLPLSLVTVLYSVIAFKIRRQNIPGENTSSIEDRRRKRKGNIIKLALAIVFGFFACWSPFQIFQILNFFVWRGNIPRSLQPHHFLLSDILVVVSCVSLIINPFICLLFSSKYKKSVCKLFPCHYSLSLLEWRLLRKHRPRRNLAQQSMQMYNASGILKRHVINM